jgi:hypothetical protein
MSHIQLIKTEYLFEFTSKEQWINKAQDWFAPYRSLADKTICLDTRGYVLTTGKDFADAEITQSYPVKVYRLVRVSEVVQKLVDDIFHPA